MYLLEAGRLTVGYGATEGLFTVLPLSPNRLAWMSCRLIFLLSCLPIIKLIDCHCQRAVTLEVVRNSPSESNDLGGGQTWETTAVAVRATMSKDASPFKLTVPCPTLSYSLLRT